MKKRLLSALLALALVFVLLPTTALAGVTTESNYDISIDGKRYKFDSDGSGGYTTAYYQENNGKTPTSNYEDVWQTNPYLEITRVDNIITITVKIGSKGPGKSVTIGASTQDINYECIAVNGAIDLIITGDTGTSLTLNKTYCGAALSATKGNITITDGVKVTASFKNKAVGNYVFYAIWAKNLTVSGANTEVTASGNCEDAIHVSGTVTVSKGAKLTATNDHNDKYKPYPITKSSAIKSDVLTIADENSCVIAQAIDSSYGKPLRIQNYNIAGATIKAGSSNYNSTETTIDKIDGNTYVKISIPALQRTSDVLIAKENAVVGQWTNIPAAATGTGSYYYDADKKELTFKDVNITHSDGAIVQFMAGAPYIIKLEGTNSIKDVSSFIRVPERGYESLDGLSVTISGAGSLEVTARGNAITMLKGDLVFNNTGAITLETNTLKGKAINVSGNISIGDDFNKNLRITADNGDMTFDPTNQYTDYNDLKNYKSITIAPKPSETYYNNTAMKYGETRDAGSGTISCDENGVITLNGVTEGTLEFRSSSDSTLILEGTNTLSSIVTTQKGLTISGSGSLTVGSIQVPDNTQHTADLIITGGAHVTVNRPSEDKPAVEVSGNLTVTGDGTQLSAECTAATNPAIEVGGNVTISGNPGTNAYTVKAYNKYDTPRDRVEGLSPSQMPSAIEISGDSLSISNSARVMAKTKSDGAAVWMPALKVISVVDASLIAQNSSHNFSTISFGDESNMGNIYAKGQEVNIVAENMLGSNSSLAHKAIKAYIYNLYSTGDSNPYYINVVSEGVHSGGNVNVIPGHCTSTGGYKVTITRGNAYSAPTTISKIIITGLTPPVKGETPVTTGVSLGTGLTVTEVTWGGTFTSDGEFKADESYTAHIKYTVDAGYMLATDAQCQDISAADTVRLNKSESQVEVTFHTAADTTHQHTSETGWETDGTNHWKTCSTCSQRYNEGACTISGYNNDNGASGYHKVLCGVGHVMKTESHDYEYKITQDGTMHYKECKTCHYTTHPVSHNFGSSGTESCECGAIPSHTHNLSGQKENDETNHWDICSECSQHVNEAPHTYGAWITDTPATDTTDGSKHRTCSVCQYQENATIPKTGTGEIEPPTPDNPGTIVIIRPAEEEKPAQQPNPSTGANDLVGLAVAAAVAAALGSAALLRKHD